MQKEVAKLMRYGSSSNRMPQPLPQVTGPLLTPRRGLPDMSVFKGLLETSPPWLPWLPWIQILPIFPTGIHKVARIVGGNKVHGDLEKEARCDRPRTDLGQCVRICMACVEAIL